MSKSIKIFAKDKIKSLRLPVATVLFLAGLFLYYLPFCKNTFFNITLLKDFGVSFYTIAVLLFLFSYLACAAGVIKSAVFNVLHGAVLDEQFLMSVASIGALAIKEVPEAVAVMLFYQIGEYFQDRAQGKTHDAIETLLKSSPQKACVLDTQTQKEVILKPQEVQIGQTIIARTGDKIAIDGIVLQGNAFLDTASLSGESTPKRVQTGTEVFAGCLVTQGLLYIKATKSYKDSSVAKMLELVENSATKKAKTQKFITKFAKVYTPVVVVLALLIAILPPMVLHFMRGGWAFAAWVNRALVFLVISCPCALVISVPLGFMSGLGKCAKNGVLIKGSQYIEALSKAKTAVFDKTGTLTKGCFVVSHIKNTPAISKSGLLRLACHAELCSNHPIAQSLKKAHFCPECNKIQNQAIEIAGCGVSATLEGKEVSVGSLDFIKTKCNFQADNVNGNTNDNITIDNMDSTQGAKIYVECAGFYMGYIVISDQLKDDAVPSIKKLKACGIKKTVMLTGDTKNNALDIGKKAGIDIIKASLLPQDKVAAIEDLLKDKKNGCVIYFGDGINDCAVLKRADVGICMGSLGQAAAIQASDIVITTDNLLKAPFALKTAKNTMKIVKQNIFFALFFKALVLVTGALGISGLWFAVFADVGVAFLAVLNSTRQLLNTKNKNFCPLPLKNHLQAF